MALLSGGQMMKRLLVVWMAALLVAPGALSISISRASAVVVQHPVSTTFLELGPDTVISQRLRGTTYYGRDFHPIDYSGGLSGTSVSTERIILQADQTFTVHNIEDFTGTISSTDGTVLGTGTAKIRFVASGSFLPDPGSFTATFTVIGGSGGLTHLHGHGTAVGVPGVPGGNGVATGHFSIGA